MTLAATYRKDLHYINTYLGNGWRNEKVVSSKEWWKTRFIWFVNGKIYKKMKGFKVLRELPEL